MKAVVYDRRARPSLVLREVAQPIPNDDEVLVRVHAASVNAMDYRTKQLGIIPKSRIFGADISGRVEAVGKGVSRFVSGDEVLGCCGSGGFAEYVAVPERALVRMPTGISFESAAAVPVAAVTALQALRVGGMPQAGQKVLVCGAGGGVGTFAVQLAKQFGAEVTAVCGEKNTSLMRALGVDAVIDYSKESFVQSGKSYDVILAINGNYPISSYRRMLAPGGACVMVGGSLQQMIKCMLFRRLMSTGGRRVLTFLSKYKRVDLESIVDLLKQGKVKPVIDRSYSLGEAAAAMEYASRGHAQGKVIVEVSPVAPIAV